VLTLALLGPVLLRRGGTALPLPVRKTQALLVLLARDGPQPRARIVSLLWSQLDESTGRRNLRRELARLRDADAADAVRADADFLALAPGVGQDAQAFEAALAAGRPDDALALWRGPPADGLVLEDAAGFADWLALEAERLNALRRRALEASAAALEAQGDVDQALLRVETLLADDPLQEQRHRDAIRLLARAGRREAALAQFERCRALLAAELGLQPMAETEALAASLRGLATAGPAAAPARLALPPEHLPFVGRSAEVAVLEAAWAAGRTVLIEGEGGIGKTRLALDFAAAHGAYALARCRPADAELPYASFTRALRALAGPTPALPELPAWAQQELARLLPELGPAPPPLRSAEERSRFFEACALGWLALAVDSFDAVVLDDAHHADAASRSLFAFVAQRRREVAPGGARELLLLRPELEAGDLERWRNSTQALHLRLQPLDGSAVFELVQRLSGAAHPARFAARLQQATAGNPFFLAETLRHLVEQRWLAVGDDGVWRTPFDDATQDYRELPVPASVHDAVLARVQRLPAASRRVLEAAALAGEPFVPALLAPACALSELDTVLAIEAAIGAQLLREHEAGGFAFAHDLVQQALDASLGEQRRRLVHRRLALGAEVARAPPALIARHHEASGDAPRAVAHRLAAGDQAQTLHALPEAMAHWQQALADGATPSQALALRVRLVRSARLRGERDAMDAQMAALQALAASGQLTARERVEALIPVAAALSVSERAAQALALLDTLPSVLPERQQVQALVVRVDALSSQGRVDDALAAAEAALALPDLRGKERVNLLNSLAIVLNDAGRTQAALAHAEAAIALCAEAGDELGLARGYYSRGVMLADRGELTRAEAELRRADEHCERLGIVHIRRAVLYNLCCLYSARSEHARVLAAAQQGWNLQPALPPSQLRVMYRLAFVDAHAALGDLGAAWEHVGTAIDEALAMQEPLAALSTAMSSLELLGLLGETARVQPLIDTVSDETMQQLRQASAELWLVRAQVALWHGDVAAARRLLAAFGDPGANENERLRVRHGLTGAELALAEGEPAQALARLPPSDAPGMNDEMRLRGLAVRVTAQTSGGALDAGTVQAARTALDAPSAHAIAALVLHRALALAARAGVAGVPGEAGPAHADCVARLARSLQAHPAQRAAFLRAWS